MKICIFMVSVLVCSISWGRNWQRIQIPGATCGDGSSYSIFLDKRDESKLLVEFMGGGACWSAATCLGRITTTWLSGIPNIPAYSYMTADIADQPWANHTAIYFPYCTGDVHAGTHVVKYDGAVIPVYHTGYTNVLKTLSYLQDNGYLDFQSFNDVTVWGASAGGIGAFTHSLNIGAMLAPGTKKTLIVDSPGLHFGDNFFSKFSPEMRQDFRDAFGNIGLFYPEPSGFVAPYMGGVFEKLKDWKIGILQAAKDSVMSIIFGELSPDDYARRVYSSGGLEAVSRAYSNVKVWTSYSYMHTFLLLPCSTKFENETQTSAIQFATAIYEGTYY